MHQHNPALIAQIQALYPEPLDNAVAIEAADRLVSFVKILREIQQKNTGQ